MGSTAVRHRKKCIEYLQAYVRQSSRVKEALIKTYGARIYAGEMDAISKKADVRKQIRRLLAIQANCPSLVVADNRAWEEFVDYIRSEKLLSLRNETLPLIRFFDSNLAVPFLIELMHENYQLRMSGKHDTEDSTGIILRDLLWKFGDEVIPYLLKQTPLTYPLFISLLVPYHLKVAQGNIGTVFEQLSKLFDCDKEHLVKPFVESFHSSGQIPDNARTFLSENFLIPSLRQFPDLRKFLFEAMLNCGEINNPEEHKDSILPGLESLLASERFDDVETALRFIRQFPFGETESYFEAVWYRFPGKHKEIIDGFTFVSSTEITDFLIRRYADIPTQEKECVITFLLGQNNESSFRFLDERFTTAATREKVIILRNLHRGVVERGKNWVLRAFQSNSPYLVSAAMQSIHHTGTLFSREELNRFIDTAHKRGVEINRGVQVPLRFVPEKPVFRNILNSLEICPDNLLSDRLTLIGYSAGESDSGVFDKYLSNPGMRNVALCALVSSRLPESVDIVTELYDESSLDEKNHIVDLITEFSDYRYLKIIRNEALRYFRKVDSFTPGEAFIVPLGRETGFRLLEGIAESGIQHSVQFMLELVRYGGAESLPILEQFAKDPEIEKIPRKKTGLELALYAAGKREHADFLLKQFEDDYLSPYLVYLLHDFCRRRDTMLLPELEKYHQLDLSPFVPFLFKQLNYYYPWDPTTEKILHLLSEGANRDNAVRLSSYLMGVYLTVHTSILDVLERFKDPHVIPVLKNTWKVLREARMESRPGMQGTLYRIAKLLNILGYPEPFEVLRELYREKFFTFLKSPCTWTESLSYLPNPGDILSPEEKTGIFLDYYDRYYPDSGEHMPGREIFLEMIEGTESPLFVPLIVKSLRLLRKETDLFPALKRLKELTGQTYGIDFHRWQEYLRDYSTAQDAGKYGMEGVI